MFPLLSWKILSLIIQLAIYCFQLPNTVKGSFNWGIEGQKLALFLFLKGGIFFWRLDRLLVILTAWKCFESPPNQIWQIIPQVIFLFFETAGDWLFTNFTANAGQITPVKSLWTMNLTSPSLNWNRQSVFHCDIFRSCNICGNIIENLAAKYVIAGK